LSLNRKSNCRRTRPLRLLRERGRCGLTVGLCSRISSFLGRVALAKLIGEIFYTLLEAKMVIQQWRREYTTIRPHSSRAIIPGSHSPWQVRSGYASANLPGRSKTTTLILVPSVRGLSVILTRTPVFLAPCETLCRHLHRLNHMFGTGDVKCIVG